MIRHRVTANELVRQHRSGALAAGDLAAWAGALTLATLGRFDFAIDRVRPSGLLTAIAIAWILQLVAGTMTALYLGRFRIGSFEEAAAVAFAGGFTVVALSAVVLVGPKPHLVPVSVPTLAGAVAVVAMAGARYLWRARLDLGRRPSGADVHRVLVFGSGDGAEQVLAAMLRDPESPFLPVALLDDDPAARRRRLLGIPVVGTREAVATAARTHKADTLLIAVPSTTAETVRDLAARADEAGLEVRIVPPVSELFGPVGLGDIRQLTDTDLLGRRQVDIDLTSIAGYLRAKRVLVTGAGGSIGSELCRQIAAFGPANLIMVDRDESALHAVQLSIEGQAMLDSPDVVLLDLRDRIGLARLLRARRPEVVFHAAALKHLPLLERHPAEAVKSNVWVTANLLAAAVDVGVERFVNISTDKAADPTSVLGYSKRIGERLTAHFARRAAGTYISVRFGNVLGSRGSVLGAFRAQIAAGAPVTVTHPEVTRYFMTVEEAVQLVVQAGAVGRTGEALVLDMGEPVRVDDVARRLVEQADAPIEIVYTGLREGEKLHEVLFGAGEVDARPVHPLISHVPVPPLDAEAVQRLDPTVRPDEIVVDLEALCATADEPEAVLTLDLDVNPSERAGTLR